jgi:hypothetical protein
MMTREPPTVPPQPGVYALTNRKRRYSYIAFTTNLQKRSHALSHMLLKHDKKLKSCYWAISDLPRHPSGEYVFAVLLTGLSADQVAAAVSNAQAEFRKHGYRVIGGDRSSSTVTFQGKSMTLVDAIRTAGTDVSYITAWRRLERGWRMEQALGLEPPDPRWDIILSAERAKRARSAKRPTPPSAPAYNRDRTTKER